MTRNNSHKVMVTIKNGHNLRQNGVASGKRGEGLDFLNIPDGGGAKTFFRF